MHFRNFSKKTFEKFQKFSNNLCFSSKHAKINACFVKFFPKKCKNKLFLAIFLQKILETFLKISWKQCFRTKGQKINAFLAFECLEIWFAFCYLIGLNAHCVFVELVAFVSICKLALLVECDLLLASSMVSFPVSACRRRSRSFSLKYYILATSQFSFISECHLPCCSNSGSPCVHLTSG